MLLFTALWTNALILAFVFQVKFIVGIAWLASPVVVIGLFMSWNGLAQSKRLLSDQREVKLLEQ